MSVSFYCPCGFISHDLDEIQTHDAPVDPESCCNCGGRRCMGCVLREWDHECADDCPECCA